MPDRRLRVAIAQIEPVLGDLDANLDKHLEWIERAQEAEVDLIVFPELSLTGYDVGARATLATAASWAPP